MKGRLTGREVRLMALAGAGLALVLLARAGGDGSSDVTMEGPEEQADVAVAASSGVGAPGGASDDLSSQLQELAGDQGIRLVDFDEVDQLPDLCEQGVDPEVLESMPAIEMSDGVSEVLDTLNFTHLEVQEEAFGDLTGDGRDEAAVRSICRYGASGRQHEVQVWQPSDDGVPTPVAVVPAPDTAADVPFPEAASVEIADEVLQVTWLVFEEGDPNCCPSGEQVVSYELTDGEVQPVG